MTPPQDEQTVLATHAAGPSDETERPGDATGGANLDRVRDILFGVQVREFERRFARLEERLVKETNDLKEDVRRRLEALETYARGEADALGEKIRAEHQERLDSSADLSRELKDTARSLERRTTALDEQAAKGHRELRQQMLDQHQRLTDDLRQKIDDVLATVAREARELRTDKADRATLASLLTEMAMRLTDELRIPGAEGAANG